MRPRNIATNCFSKVTYCSKGGIRLAFSLLGRTLPQVGDMKDTDDPRMAIGKGAKTVRSDTSMIIFDPTRNAFSRLSRTIKLRFSPPASRQYYQFVPRNPQARRQNLMIIQDVYNNRKIVVTEPKSSRGSWIVLAVLLVSIAYLAYQVTLQVYMRHHHFIDQMVQTQVEHAQNSPVLKYFEDLLPEREYKPLRRAPRP
jgi:hypothetical protein